MKLEISCALCGRHKEIDISTDKPVPTIEEIITAQGWIVEHNGPHFDVYCSRRCAE